MRFAIIESCLKGMPEPPQTVEGLMKKVNELTAGMRFPPLSYDEMSRLADRFCRQAREREGMNGRTSNKGRRRTKDDEMKNESSEDF